METRPVPTVSEVTSDVVALADSLDLFENPEDARVIRVFLGLLHEYQE